jgi:hypothetical protein
MTGTGREGVGESNGVTVHRGEGFVRYLSMPGFYEAWTFADGRRPVYAEQCAPVRAGDIPTGVLVSLWDAMGRESGYVPTESDRRAS